MLSSDALQLAARRSTACGEQRVIACITARYCLDQHSISIMTLCVDPNAHRRGELLGVADSYPAESEPTRHRVNAA